MTPKKKQHQIPGEKDSYPDCGGSSARDRGNVLREPFQHVPGRE